MFIVLNVCMHVCSVKNCNTSAQNPFCIHLSPDEAGFYEIWQFVLVYDFLKLRAISDNTLFERGKTKVMI